MHSGWRTSQQQVKQECSSNETARGLYKVQTSARGSSRSLTQCGKTCPSARVQEVDERRGSRGGDERAGQARTEYHRGLHADGEALLETALGAEAARDALHRALLPEQARRDLCTQNTHVEIHIHIHIGDLRRTCTSASSIRPATLLCIRRPPPPRLGAAKEKEKEKGKGKRRGRECQCQHE